MIASYKNSPTNQTSVLQINKLVLYYRRWWLKPDSEDSSVGTRVRIFHVSFVGLVSIQ